MKWKDRIISFFFPDRCPYCNDLTEPGEAACARCMNRWITPHKPLIRGIYGCRMVSSLRYEDHVRRAVINMKFHGRTQFIPQFVQIMHGDIQSVFADEQFDAIIYVPMHPDDKHERGFNQSEQMARQLSELLSIPCVDVLIKVKQTEKQHHLKGDQRAKNLKNAFRLRRDVSLNGCSLLLIDDIITTGATLTECIRTLNKGAPARICCATFASAAGDVNFDTSSDSY